MAGDTERYAGELTASSYASWRYFIETKCSPALMSDFLKARIGVLNDRAM